MEPQWQPPGNVPRPDWPPPGNVPPAYGPPVYGHPGYGWAPAPQGPHWGQPAGPSAAWAVVLWILAVGGLVGVLLFGAIAAAGFYSNSYFDAYGVTTTATVTDLQRLTDTVTVEFTTDDGTPAKAEIVWLTDAPAVGSEVEITYDPYDPSYATEAGGDSDVVMGIVYAVVAVFALAVMVGAVVGAVLVHRARGKAKRQRPTW